MRYRVLGLLLAAVTCSPATTRPSFRPLPQAIEFMVVADPVRVTQEVVAWVAAAGVVVQRVSERDRYVETEWYVPPADSAAPAFPFRVKTRVWADPAGQGRTRVVIETVYRPVEDPSRPARDLEVAAPVAADGQARRLAGALRERFEVV